MDFPNVEITDITGERDKLITTRVPSRVNLGGDHSVRAAVIEDRLGPLRAARRQQETRVFRLRWEGSKIPRGANLLGHVVMWTQNGQVHEEGGTVIGSYDRIVEFGGESGKTQEMIIYMTAPAVQV